MTDRYTELVKQAYEAQQAREGERYQALTADLAKIDADLEALAAKREEAVAALESMDDAVEAAKEALDAYFAGRDEDAGRELFEDAPVEDAPFIPDVSKLKVEKWEGNFFQDFTDDEFATPRANGAYTET